MIKRDLFQEIQSALKNFPSVAILGARQTGKTTIAKQLVKEQKKRTIYLDLENPSDRDKLSDPYSYLNDNKEKLIIIDEIQRMPELFAILRSLIDHNRKPGRFLVLGSASPDLVKGVSESLAGRIFYSYMNTINFSECKEIYSLKKHWFRGGFPDMLTAKNDLLFTQRMDAFILTFIERDLHNLFGVSFSNGVMRRFWQMLAHSNGGIWNAQAFAGSLEVSAPTINRYLDFLEGAFMIHKLPAWYFNARKRIIKAPKIYLRDTGIMHRLVRLNSYDDLYGHPLFGASWEAYVVEQVFQLKNKNIEMHYYRTQDGAEADIVLTKAGKPVSCIEIKAGNVPNLSKGFHETIKDLKTTQNFVIVPQVSSYKKTKDITIAGIGEFLELHLGKIK